MSLIFSLQSIVYINDLGDQNWFRAMFSKYSFLEFALFRYQTWSSRLLIESVTMFMAAHYLIFDLCMFISVILFFYYFNGVFLKDEKYYKLRFVTPVLFLLAFPSVFFTSAGLIATVTNYLFPMVAFIGAWYYLEKRKKGYFILSLLLMVFACMQEQFTIYALLTNVLENASVDKKKLTSEQQAIANDLKLVQYDITIGKGYLKNYQSFFEIAK